MAGYGKQKPLPTALGKRYAFPTFPPPPLRFLSFKKKGIIVVPDREKCLTLITSEALLLECPFRGCREITKEMKAVGDLNRLRRTFGCTFCIQSGTVARDNLDTRFVL